MSPAIAPLKIALPKGRMSTESIEYMNSRGLTALRDFHDSRQLIYRDEANLLEFYLIRSKDVGTYVEQGGADLGVMGFDILQEHPFDVFVPMALPFGDCRLSVAYPAGNDGWQKRRNIRVATKYPRLASRFFYEHGFNIEIIELYGSIEIAPLTGLSDVIVDLVSSGQTLKVNNLVEDKIILHSSARLIVNPASYVFRRSQINRVMDLLAS